MVGLHPGVEHRHLRAAGPLVPRAGRVDVVVVRLLDRVLLADAGVVGALRDADRTVVLDPLHAVAVAQPGPELLEAHAGAAADGGRADQAQPQLHAAAGAADDLLQARVVRVAAELHEQAGDRGRLPASVREAILPEVDLSRRRRGRCGDQDGDGSDQDKTVRHAHAPTLAAWVPDC